MLPDPLRNYGFLVKSRDPRAVFGFLHSRSAALDPSAVVPLCSRKGGPCPHSRPSRRASRWAELGGNRIFAPWLFLHRPAAACENLGMSVSIRADGPARIRRGIGGDLKGTTFESFFSWASEEQAMVSITAPGAPARLDQSWQRGVRSERLAGSH